MAPTAPNYSRDVETTLGLSAGADSAELIDRVTLAKRYVATWAKGGWKGAKSARIEGVAEQLADLTRSLRKEAPFPSRKTATAYDRTSSAYAALYRELVFAPEQIDQGWVINVPSPIPEAMAYFIALTKRAAFGGGIALVGLGALYLLAGRRRR